MSVDTGNYGGRNSVRAPTHPVPQLQKPFEESMLESVTDLGDQEVPMDAMTRRVLLLESPQYTRVIAGRWKQKPGEKYHPLWKLTAQMSFGMHLLAENMAISEEEVMRILQSHVDDIDGFLERTTEDFDLALSDIHERLRCLKLPLAHGDVFDRMLEDRAFRTSILDGNEKIDHVMGRTKKASRDALKDVQKGFDATNVLEKYLTKLHSTWRRDSSEHEAVLVAMLGNAEGWRRAFLELHLQGNKLAGSLKKLGEVVAEMQRRAATVSRNLILRETQRARHLVMQKTGQPAHSQTPSAISHKPLPTEPGQRHSTRHSSRSTQATGSSSRPNSGNKSSQGMSTSQPSITVHESPRSQISKHPESLQLKLANTGVTTGNLDQGKLQSSAGSPEHALALLQAELEHPIELPADVPEDVMRQAPVSIKNRLSTTLGLKSKDNSDHRISSVYYPRALADLLKSPPPVHMLLTPHSTKSKGTPVIAIASPTDNDYFSTREGKSYFDHAGPENKQSSSRSSPAGMLSTRASATDLKSKTGRNSVPNPAFTSHANVMAMASPPVELPAVVDIDDHVSAGSKEDLGSSLGEPGPEVADGATTRSASISGSGTPAEKPISIVSPPSIVLEAGVVTPSDFDRLISEKPAIETSDPLGHEPILFDASVLETILEDAKSAEGAEGAENISSTEIPAVNVATGAAQRGNISIVVELEAAPVAPTASKNFGPVELEAPHHQTFKLPPRPTEPPKGPVVEPPTATIRQIEDFFKLPTEAQIKPGVKPMDFGGTSGQPIRPLKLKLAKMDGKMVPVQVGSPGTPTSTPTSTANTRSKIRGDVVADIIEAMSHTPPGSPMHDRSSSNTSTNSAQIWSQRSSRSLGPPDHAPAPPGPGGPRLVNPDYAAAGEFEGERKQKKKSSGGSKSGWKAFLPKPGHNSLPAGSVAVTADSKHSVSGQGRPNSEAVSSQTGDMLTSAGNDVLWFKGEAKKVLGIATA